MDDRGVQYDLPLGDDIARYIADAMVSQSTGWTFRHPVREDFGAILDCLFDNACICMIVTWFPRDEFDDRWAIQFQQSRGLLYFFRKQRPDLITKLTSDLDSLVRERVDVFTHVEWLTKSEFLAIS